MELRRLSKDEQAAYTAGVVSAVDIMPAFRDGLALMRPYYNSSSPFAQIDEHSRIGLGPSFFKASPKQRASVLLHETMHVFNNHFSRQDSLPIAEQELVNEGGDLEINYHLNKIPKIDISFGILPDDYGFPGGLTMEQYVYKIREQRGSQGETCSPTDNSKDAEGDSQGSDSSNSEGSPEGERESGASKSEQGDNSSDSEPSQSGGGGSPGGSDASPGLSKKEFSKLSEAPCGEVDEETSAAADKAGIEKASNLEKSIAKKNTRARLEEESKKARMAGKGHLGSFVDYVLDQLEPPKVSWQRLFAPLVGKTYSEVIPGKSDYSYMRVNRRMASVSSYIFPGYVSYLPKAMVGIDTSGSMQDDDYLFTLSEIDAIVRKVFNSNSIQLFTVDTKVSNIQPVRRVEDLELKGGGGTDMTAAWEYILELPKKEIPDVFVLATDGGFYNWAAIKGLVDKAKVAGVNSIILITEKNGYENISEDFKKTLTILDISDNRNGSF